MNSAAFLCKARAVVQLGVLSLISPHFEQWYDTSHFVILEKSA